MDPDLIKARTWCEKAAAQNYPKAQAYLAILHFDKTRPGGNPEEGLKWLRQAALNNAGDSQYLLALRTFVAVKTPDEVKEASRWLLIAAANTNHTIGIWTNRPSAPEVEQKLRQSMSEQGWTDFKASVEALRKEIEENERRALRESAEN